MNMPFSVTDGAPVVIVPSNTADVRRIDGDWSRWRVAGKALATDGFERDCLHWQVHAHAPVRLLGEAVAPDSPAQWCAAIDPVFLQADMRDVQIRNWPRRDVTGDVAADYVQMINEFLADDPEPRLRAMRVFQADPSRWYLLGQLDDALQVTAEAPGMLVGKPLRHAKPGGQDAPIAIRLTTELQMLTHQIAERRAAAANAHLPINGVWIWGAGVEPEDVKTQPLPALCSDDPFWVGCWRLAGQKSAVQPVDPTSALVEGGVVAPLTVNAAKQAIEYALSSAFGRVRIVATDGELDMRRAGWLRRQWRQLGRGT
ncbi:MAG: hypothetical protein AAF270_08610 [Pseudomonadota bacterium]